MYVGCNQALNGYTVDGCSGYHGSDGFGDCPDPAAPNPSLIKTEDGVDALIRLSKENTGKKISKWLKMCVLIYKIMVRDSTKE